MEVGPLNALGNCSCCRPMRETPWPQHPLIQRFSVQQLLYGKQELIQIKRLLKEGEAEFSPPVARRKSGCQHDVGGLLELRNRVQPFIEVDAVDTREQVVEQQ
jgi:hypothetical protein